MFLSRRGLSVAPLKGSIGTPPLEQNRHEVISIAVHVDRDSGSASSTSSWMHLTDTKIHLFEFWRYILVADCSILHLNRSKIGTTNARQCQVPV